MVHTDLTIAVMLMGIVYRTQAVPTDSERCQGCTQKNAIGVMGFLDDCSKYVYCAIDTKGVVHGAVRPCAFGMNWNLDILSCVLPSNSTCVTTKDICNEKSDGIRRPGVGNCRGYLECKNGESVALCCPIDYYFNGMTDNCESNNGDHECNDKCFKEITKTVEDKTTAPSSCYNKRPMTGVLNVYEESVKGKGWIQRRCPNGLLYQQKDCDCTLRVVVQRKCEPDLFLSFENGVNGQSPVVNYIKSKNVKVIDGKAIFKAEKGSQLVIQRYKNFCMTSLTINLKYFSDHKRLPQSQAIISNSDCGIAPSIVLTEDSAYVYFTVATELGERTLAVHQPSHTNDKNLELTYHNGILSGTVNKLKKTLKINGSGINKIPCALHVGSAQGYSGLNFTGVIDELSLSLCV
ncbi:protein PIF-like [Mya arenaria]|uniref:protein PIF-like n=1 Tax=Mya arenaria TaxID=6604 RepID=UPI0022E53188|nr:protein PIF-like [Mya arenaria]